MSAAWASPVRCLAQVDSTMRHARLWARAGAPHGATVQAWAQTAGRGRRGHAWFSPPGGGLYMTVILRPECRAVASGGLALVVGQALLVAVRRLGVRAQLKWPNDLVVRHRKLAGILLEAEWDSRAAGGVVLAGIGLNVAARPQVVFTTPEVEARYLGMRDVVPTLPEGAVGLAALRHAVLSSLAAGWSQWACEGLEPCLTAWRRADALHGQRITAEGPHGRVGGVACGLDGEGRLRLRTAAGITAIQAGEVHLLPAGPSGEITPPAAPAGG